MNMSRRTRAAAVFVALVTLPGTVQAQGAPPLGDAPRPERRVLVAGDVVRVTAPPLVSERLEGRVVAVLSDTLIVEGVAEPAGRTAIPLESISRLEVRRDPSGRVGAVFGVLVGAVIGATAAGELSEDGNNLVRNLSVIGGATVGVVGGYFVGSRIDKAITGSHWVRVPVASLQAALGPVPGIGFGLYLSRPF
jgi:hypothetical protein